MKKKLITLVIIATIMIIRSKLSNINYIPNHNNIKTISLSVNELIK